MDAVKLGESSTQIQTLPKKKKVPKVAIYVLGATLGITVGLTALVIPFIRQAAKLSKPSPTFISHRYSHLPLRSPPPPPPSTRPIASETTSFDELKATRAFNDREEARLYGPRTRTKIGDDGEEVEEVVEPVSPWMGAQALGIATGIVCGTAALSAFVIAKITGVSDMDQFAKQMRQNMSSTFPNAMARITKPDDPSIPVPTIPYETFVKHDGEVDEDALAKWVKWVESQDEESGRSPS